MSALRMGWPRATLGGSGESEPCLVSIFGVET